MLRFFAKQTETHACQDEVGLSLQLLSRLALTTTVIRDVRDRGRDVEGIIKQWFAFVKPNFEKARPEEIILFVITNKMQYVDPQRKVADIIVPRGVENRVAMCKSSYLL